MALMSRLPLVAVAGAACAALALPAYASAEIIEIGKIDPPPTPSCPDAPVPRRQPHHRLPGEDRHDARRHDDPQGRQHRRLDDRASASRARSRPRSSTTSSAASRRPRSRSSTRAASCARARSARATRRSSRPTSARTVQFPLAKSIPVKKGWVVALTVPTWAPALAVGLGADTSWRASRGKGTCEDTSTNTVQTQPNQLAQYYCLYKTARLAYSATLVTAPDARGRAQDLAAAGATAPGARSASRRRRARSAGGRAGGPSGPATARCARGARGSRPSAAGRGISAPAKRCSTAATARSSSSREEMTSLCGDAHALTRAARGRPAK